MLPYESEMLQRMWFPVARVEDVGADRPFGAALLGRRLVVFRGADGLTVATDRCPHRGARLSLGRMANGALECPYHGWRWDPAGHCALVPSQPSAHPNAALETRPARVRFGLVWTTLADALIEPPSIPEMDDSEGGWALQQGPWFEVGCGLRSITENFRDSSHFAFVHRETFADVNPEIPAYTVRTEGWRLAWEIPLTFGSAWSVAGGAREQASKYRFGKTDGDGATTDDTEEMLLKYRFELPALSYVYTEHERGARRLVCQLAAPLDADGVRCRVFFFVAADAEFRQQQGGLAAQVEIEARVFAEDVPIVETLDPVEAPLEVEGQAHVRADRYSVAYRRLYGAMLDRFRESQEGDAPFDASRRAESSSPLE